MRVWNEPAERLLLWAMLNPSIADAEQDDATLRRCISFSKREGYDGLVVVNRCAWRSPDPFELKQAGARAVGPDNDATIQRWMADPRVDRVVAAWGAHTVSGWSPVLLFADDADLEVVCLGRNKGGSPRHPLYLKDDTPLELYEGKAAAWAL